MVRTLKYSHAEEVNAFAEKSRRGAALARWFTPRRRVEAAAALLVAGVLVGVALWVRADSGTKAVDLGAGLIATGAFGIMLLTLERALAVRLDEAAKTTAALSPTGGETKDPAAPTTEPLPGPTTPPTASPPLRPFTARFAGWIRDANRIDASQIRVRVYVDGAYFQFFTGVVSGPALRAAVHNSTSLTLDQYKRGCGLAMVRAIQNAIAIGGVPLGDPTIAVEVLVDSELAGNFAAGAPARPLVDDEEIAAWLG